MIIFFHNLPPINCEAVLLSPFPRRVSREFYERRDVRGADGRVGLHRMHQIVQRRLAFRSGRANADLASLRLVEERRDVVQRGGEPLASLAAHVRVHRASAALAQHLHQAQPRRQRHRRVHEVRRKDEIERCAVEVDSRVSKHPERVGAVDQEEAQRLDVSKEHGARSKRYSDVVVHTDIATPRKVVDVEVQRVFAVEELLDREPIRIVFDDG